MKKQEAPENLFPDVPKEQRSAKIAEIAVKQNIEKVKRQYSDDEKLQMKDFVIDETAIVMEETKKFKAIQKEFNDAVKKNKEGIADAVTRYKQGYSENEETVYGIDDQENGVMNVFDANGEFLYTRKLFPDERQVTILNLEKTGTNG